jgi:hypothetical protein
MNLIDLVYTQARRRYGKSWGILVRLEAAEASPSWPLMADSVTFSKVVLDLDSPRLCKLTQAVNDDSPQICYYRKSGEANKVGWAGLLKGNSCSLRGRLCRAYASQDFKKGAG